MHDLQGERAHERVRHFDGRGSSARRSGLGRVRGGPGGIGTIVGSVGVGGVLDGGLSRGEWDGSELGGSVGVRGGLGISGGLGGSGLIGGGGLGGRRLPIPVSNCLAYLNHV